MSAVVEVGSAAGVLAGSLVVPISVEVSSIPVVVESTVWAGAGSGVVLVSEVLGDGSDVVLESEVGGGSDVVVVDACGVVVDDCDVVVVSLGVVVVVPVLVEVDGLVDVLVLVDGDVVVDVEVPVDELVVGRGEDGEVEVPPVVVVLLPPVE